MSQPPKRKRIVVCRGVYCNAGRRADQNLKILEPLLQDLNGDTYPPPCKLEVASCLDMCGAGPNLIIYPENVICNGVSEDEIERIVETYLRE